MKNYILASTRSSFIKFTKFTTSRSSQAYSILISHFRSTIFCNESEEASKLIILFAHN